MLELLSMLGGGLFRLLPSLLDFFKGKADAAHEYRMAGLQLQIDQARAAQQIDLAHANASIATAAGEMAAWQAAIDAQAKPSGVGLIDALSASVRPVLTYYWCVGLYGGAKFIQVAVALQAGTPLAGLVPVLITDFDRSVIGSMLAFWFVDRALRHLRA